MKICIDISQLAYPGTGVANYLESLLENLLKSDQKNEYVLFFSSLRGSLPEDFLRKVLTLDKKITLKKFSFPPKFLTIQ